MILREARPADVTQIVELIHALAAYEGSPESCTVTEAQLHGHLWAATPAVFAVVAEDDARIVGVCVWYLNFSTWDGVHGIQIEDLFVVPEYRGRGLGRAFFIDLARMCRERGYSRIQWHVLDSNAPAMGFYRSLGAERWSGWHTQRLSGTELAALGEDDQGLPYAQSHDQGGRYG